MLKILVFLLFAPLTWGSCDISSFNTSDIRRLHEDFIAKPNANSAIEFFNSIPNKFCEFNGIYGYNKKAGPLYEIQLYETFDKLALFIDSETLQNKYIILASEAHWNADNVNYLKHSYNALFLKIPQYSIERILKLPKSKRATAISFLFDGPHPSQSILRGKNKARICDLNQEFCLLLNSVEKKLLAHEHEH